MSRVYGEKCNLNHDKVKRFFDERSQKKTDSILSLVMYQDKENVEKRHALDVSALTPLLKLSSVARVFEIGCGVGRWADALHQKIGDYLGIDFASGLIKIAQENFNYPNCKYQVMSANSIEQSDLLLPPPYDIVIFSGILMYLDDCDVQRLFLKLNNMLKPEFSQILVREPISVLSERVTLDAFYSEGLQSEYSAIYRTEPEMYELFATLKGFDVMHSGFSYNKVLDTRAETQAKYYILERNGENK